MRRSRSIDKALAKIPTLRRAQLLADNQREQDAITCYRQAIQQSPKDLVYHLRLTQLLRQEQQFDAAISLYREALQRPFIQQYPRSHLFIRRDLVQILLEQKNTAAALVECQQILQIDPTDAYALRTLETVHRQQKKVS